MRNPFIIFRRASSGRSAERENCNLLYIKISFVRFRLAETIKFRSILKECFLLVQSVVHSHYLHTFPKKSGINRDMQHFPYFSLSFAILLNTIPTTLYNIDFQTERLAVFGCFFICPYLVSAHRQKISPFEHPKYIYTQKVCTDYGGKTAIETNIAKQNISKISSSTKP